MHHSAFNYTLPTLIFPLPGLHHISIHQRVIKLCPSRQTAPAEFLLVIIYRNKHVLNLIGHLLLRRLVKVFHLILFKEEVVLVFVVLGDLVEVGFVKEGFFLGAHIEELQLVFKVLLLKQVLLSPDQVQQKRLTVVRLLNPLRDTLPPLGVTKIKHQECGRRIPEKCLP